MTDSPVSPALSDDVDHRPADRSPRAGHARRRRVVATATVVALVGLLGNAVAVSRQTADATGPSILHVDGGAVHVDQDGPPDAPALVLIHGLGGSTDWWARVVPTLAASFRVIRIDLLGHGRSAKPAGGGYPIPQQGRLVGQVLDRLGVRGAVVVGHSTGGYVATALAEQRGDLVAALALVDTGPRMDAFVSDGPVGRLVLTPVVGQLLWRLRTDGILRRSLSTAFAPGFVIPRQLVDDTRRVTYHALVATSQAADDYLARGPLPDRLAHLGKPLLVIFGEQDRRWRPSSAALYRAVPGADVEMMPGVGHSPMLEDPQRTAALLLRFAGRTSAG